LRYKNLSFNPISISGPTICCGGSPAELIIIGVSVVSG
jgi:hypothetical protein